MDSLISPSGNQKKETQYEQTHKIFSGFFGECLMHIRSGLCNVNLRVGGRKPSFSGVAFSEKKSFDLLRNAVGTHLDQTSSSSLQSRAAWKRSCSMSCVPATELERRKPARDQAIPGQSSLSRLSVVQHSPCSSLVQVTAQLSRYRRLVLVGESLPDTWQVQLQRCSLVMETTHLFQFPRCQCLVMNPQTCMIQGGDCVVGWNIFNS